MTPLHVILVADFSRVLAGPLAGRLLGALGADVVKVERPDGGDDTRAWGPPWRGEEATYYLGLNRNKRSLALDLGDPADVGLARRLAGRADVLIESFRPGVMARWGLDGETLRAGNPRLVTCSVTAFGTQSCDARALPGYDFLAQAMGGLMSVTGEPDGRPLKAGAAVIDLVCGLLAAIGIHVAHAGELAELLEAVLRTRPADAWFDVLRAASVPAGPINDVAEAFALAESLGMQAVPAAGGHPPPGPPPRP